MKGVIAFVRRYPLAVFVVLSYLLSWWVWPLKAQGLVPTPNAAFGPFLAALIVLSLTAGKTGVTTLLRRMIHWRVGWQWYALALGLPILLGSLAVYLAVQTGAPAPSAEQLAGWPGIFITFVFALLIPGLGGAWEEPGWRGYALHRLEMGRSRLWALLPLWLIIVVWHLPMFFTGGAEWVDVLNMVGAVIVYNWLYHRSGQSVLLVMIIHAMNNASAGEFFSPMFTGGYSVQYAWMRTLVWGVVGAIVLVANWRWWTQTDEGAVTEQKAALNPVVGV
jgi:membrane protease YdiL (CAAX protease family)